MLSGGRAMRPGIQAGSNVPFTADKHSRGLNHADNIPQVPTRVSFATRHDSDEIGELHPWRNRIAGLLLLYRVRWRVLLPSDGREARAD